MSFLSSNILIQQHEKIPEPRTDLERAVFVFDGSLYLVTALGFIIYGGRYTQSETQFHTKQFFVLFFVCSLFIEMNKRMNE
jgi:hypothetical protein